MSEPDDGPTPAGAPDDPGDSAGATRGRRRLVRMKARRAWAVGILDVAIVTGAAVLAYLLFNGIEPERQRIVAMAADIALAVVGIIRASMRLGWFPTTIRAQLGWSGGVLLAAATLIPLITSEGEESVEPLTTPRAGLPGSSGPPVSSPPSAVSYDVNAEPRESVDIALGKEGTVIQDFFAATSSVNWVGVIAGCDGALRQDCGPSAGGGYFGDIKIEILDGEEVLATATVGTVNNRMSEGPLNNPATPLRVGQVYSLRVTNTTDGPIGIYVAQSDIPGLDTTVAGAFHGARDEGTIPHDLAALVDNR